jgi:hypothetical protein
MVWDRLQFPEFRGSGGGVTQAGAAGVIRISRVVVCFRVLLNFKVRME